MANSKQSSNIFNALINGENPKKQVKEKKDLGVHRNEMVREIVGLFLSGCEDFPSLENTVKQYLWGFVKPPTEAILWLSDKFLEYSSDVVYNPSKTGKLPSVRIILTKFVNMLFDSVQIPNDGIYPNPTCSDLEQVAKLFLTTVNQGKKDIPRFPTLVVEQSIKLIYSYVRQRIFDLVNKEKLTFDFNKLNYDRVKEEVLNISSNSGLKPSPYLQKLKPFVELGLNSTPLDIEEVSLDSIKTFLINVLENIRPLEDGKYPKLPLRVREQLKDACKALKLWHFAEIDFVKSNFGSNKMYYTFSGKKIPAYLKNTSDSGFKEENFVDYTNGKYFFAKAKSGNSKQQVCIMSDRYADMNPYTFDPENQRKASFLPKKGDLVCFMVDENSDNRKNITAGPWFYCSYQLRHRNSILDVDNKGNFRNQGQDFLTWDDVRSDLKGTNGYRKMLISKRSVGLPEMTLEEKEVLYFFLRIEAIGIAHCSFHLSTVELLRFGMLPRSKSCPLRKDGVPSLMEPDIPVDFHKNFLETWTDYDPQKDHGMTWEEVYKGIYSTHPQYIIDEMKQKFQEEIESKMKGFSRKEIETKFEACEFPGLSSFPAPPLKKEDVAPLKKEDIAPLKKERRRKGKNGKQPVLEEKQSENGKIPSFRDILERQKLEPIPIAPLKKGISEEFKKNDNEKDVVQKKKEKKKQQRSSKTQKINLNKSNVFTQPGGWPEEYMLNQNDFFTRPGGWAEECGYQQQTKIYVKGYSE